MFTLEDICNIAIQIERNGAETYRNASKTAKNPQLAETLVWMAEEEDKHAEWFRSIRSNVALTPEQKKMETIGRSLLQDIVKNNTFSLNKSELKNSNKLTEIISQSIEFEHDTILFYEVLLGFLDNDETTRQLNTIIQEERNHIKKLEMLAGEKEVHFCTTPL